MIPSLKGAKYIKDWVGLRPSRNPVRIERDRVHHEGRSYEVTKSPMDHPLLMFLK